MTEKARKDIALAMTVLDYLEKQGALYEREIKAIRAGLGAGLEATYGNFQPKVWAVRIPHEGKVR